MVIVTRQNLLSMYVYIFLCYSVSFYNNVYIIKLPYINKLWFLLLIFHKVLHCLDMAHFISPTSIALLGPSQSGKTTFVVRLLLHVETMIIPPPVKIYYAYTAWQPLFEKLKDKVTFHEGLPNKTMMDTWSSDLEPIVVVLDDLMDQIVSNKEVLHYVTVMSHHSNIMLIMMFHNIYPPGKYARTISLNCHYLVLFNNARDALQVMNLGRQILPRQTAFYIDAYEKAMNMSRCNYLVTDLHPQSDKQLRIRTRIMPDDVGPPRIYKAI